MIASIAVFALTLFCCITDIRSRKIYNAATYPAIVFGLLLSLIQTPSSLRQSLGGILCGLALFGGLALLGRVLIGGKGNLGGGDIKLIIAIGALKSMTFVLTSSFYAVCFGCIGGVLLLARNGQLWAMVQPIVNFFYPVFSPPTTSIRKVKTSFGPYLFLGVLFALWQEYSGSLLLRFPQ